MAGITRRIQDRTDYLLPALTFMGGKTMTVTIARRVPVDGWRECTILGRVHGCNLYSSIQLSSGLDPYTDEDPALLWQSTAALSSVTWTYGTDLLPQAKELALTPPFGPLIAIQWQFTAAFLGIGDTLVSVSVDINLKGA